MSTLLSETAWGVALRRQREAAKLTQDALARLLSEAGVLTAMTSISRWELGKVTPPAHRRMIIEKILSEEAAKRRGLSNGEAARWRESVLADPPEIERVRMIYQLTGGTGAAWEELVKRIAEVRDMMAALKSSTSIKHPEESVYAGARGSSGKP